MDLFAWEKAPFPVAATNMVLRTTICYRYHDFLFWSATYCRYNGYRQFSSDGSAHYGY